MYRPTVRYDDVFKEYVDGVFAATKLDRNQIMRLALFLLGHTKEGKDALTFYSTSPLPNPKWNLENMVLWYGAETPFRFSEGERIEEKGVASHEYDNQKSIPGYPGQAAQRNDRKIYRQAQTKEGIIISIGNGTTILY